MDDIYNSMPNPGSTRYEANSSLLKADCPYYSSNMGIDEKSSAFPEIERDKRSERSVLSGYA